jgi:hypothetical protein
MEPTPESGQSLPQQREVILRARAEQLAREKQPLVFLPRLDEWVGPSVLERAEQGELGAAELAAIIERWYAVLSPARHSLSTAMIPVADRLPGDPMRSRRVAVSRVLAADLVTDSALWARIDRFRKRYLLDTLLAWEVVDSWVGVHQQEEGSASYSLNEVPVSREQVQGGIPVAPEGYTTLTLTVTVPLPEFSTLEPETRNDVGAGVGRLESRWLEYLNPESTTTTRSTVTAGRALDALRELSQVMADQKMYPWWTRAQASTFLLTGLVPYVETYGTFQLDINPLLPLNKIMEQVEQTRHNLVGERARDMSLKHLHLAVFTAEHPDEPWADRLRTWNDEYPEWRYPESRRSNFARDSLVAKRRLLLQEYA